MRSFKIFPTIGGMGTSSQIFAHSSHLEKKSPSHPTPNFYFPKQLSQSLWTGTSILKNGIGIELSLWIGGSWDKAPTVREIYKLDDITYLCEFSKLDEKNTLLRLSNSWYQHLLILLRLLYQIYKYESSMNSTVKKKKILANFA